MKQKRNWQFNIYIKIDEKPMRTDHKKSFSKFSKKDIRTDHEKQGVWKFPGDLFLMSVTGLIM